MKLSQKRYSLTAVEKFLPQVEKAGYEIVTIPGGLLDSYICIAPRDDYYNFEIRETYLNEWSSCYTVHQWKKLPKRVLSELVRILVEYAEKIDPWNMGEYAGSYNTMTAAELAEQIRQAEGWLAEYETEVS